MENSPVINVLSCFEVGAELLRISHSQPGVALRSRRTVAAFHSRSADVNKGAAKYIRVMRGGWWQPRVVKLPSRMRGQVHRDQHERLCFHAVVRRTVHARSERLGEKSPPCCVDADCWLACRSAFSSVASWRVVVPWFGRALLMQDVVCRQENT